MEEEEIKQDVFSSPLFMRNGGNGLLASIKSSLKNLKNSLIQQNSLDKDSNRSSPAKLSPSKYQPDELIPRGSGDHFIKLNKLDVLER